MRYNPLSYAHMCCDEHVQIGHDDSDHERCPLCRAIGALQFIADGYDNQDVNHVDYRVRVYQVATEALETLVSPAVCESKND